MKPMHKKLFVMNALIFTMLALSMIGQVAQPSTAQAAETNTGEIQYTLLEPLPCIPGDGVTCQEGKMQTSVNFETYVQYIFNLIIAFAAVAAVLMIVWGGFKYVTSDSFLGKNEGKKVIIQALQGLLLVLCSYLILRTIDPRLVAIPSTIVEPLKIKCASNTSILASDPKCASVTTDFFEKISNEAQKYQGIGQTFVDQAKQAKAEVSASQKNIDSLYLQLDDLYMSGYDDGDPEIETIKTEINRIAGNITNKKAQIEVDLAKSIINNAGISQTLQQVNLEKINGGNDPEDINDAFDTGIELVNKTRDTRNSELIALGAYNAINDVNDQANYAESLLLLKKTATRIESTQPVSVISVTGRKYVIFDGKEVYAEQAKTTLLSDIEKTLSGIKNIKDPKLKADLLVQYNAMKIEYNKKFVQ